MPTVHNPHRWTRWIKPTKSAGKHNDLGILRTCQQKECRKSIVDWSNGMIHKPNEMIAAKYNRLNWQVSDDFKVCLCPRCTPIGKRQAKRIGLQRSKDLGDLEEMLAADRPAVDFNDTAPIEVVVAAAAKVEEKPAKEEVAVAAVAQVPEVRPEVFQNPVPPVAPKRIIAAAPAKPNGTNGSHAPVEPSEAQREALQTALQLLFQEYDPKRGCYRTDAWHDDRIAVVSGLSVKAVKTERERLFGPIKEDPRLAGIVGRLDALQQRVEADKRDLEEWRTMSVQSFNEIVAELTKLRAEAQQVLRR